MLATTLVTIDNDIIDDLTSSINNLNIEVQNTISIMENKFAQQNNINLGVVSFQASPAKKTILGIINKIKL